MFQLSHRLQEGEQLLNMNKLEMLPIDKKIKEYRNICYIVSINYHVMLSWHILFNGTPSKMKIFPLDKYVCVPTILTHSSLYLRSPISLTSIYVSFNRRESVF